MDVFYGGISRGKLASSVDDFAQKITSLTDCTIIVSQRIFNLIPEDIKNEAKLRNIKIKILEELIYGGKNGEL